MASSLQHRVVVTERYERNLDGIEEIVHAFYGPQGAEKGWAKTKDVTDQVKKLKKGMEIHFEGEAFNKLFGDPAPGRKKELVIVYKGSKSPSFMDTVKAGIAAEQHKMDRLKNMDLFVLDNSMRETTVGEVRAHTMDNKVAIYEEIKRAGFKYFIVESFNSQNRLGDVFLKEMIRRGEDLSDAFCFSDIWEKINDEKVPQPDLPIGLKKCKEYDIKNVVLEIDLMWYGVDYEHKDFDICALLWDRIEWIREHLAKDAKILVNLRDFSSTMQFHPERVEEIVRYLSAKPDSERIFGLAYEDLGKCLPGELAAWTRAIVALMDRHGWGEGHLLFHLHEQWGLMHAANLEVLAAGATGMWAGMCIEGAAMGHADSTTAILNLVRLGNTKVQKTYNCKYLREAAINLTRLITGKPPHPKQPVYGARAMDLVFGFLFSDPTAQGGFDLAEFLGVKRTVRMSNMANPDMIVMKLKEKFGENEQFNLKMASRMKDQMLKILAKDRKEEFDSAVGLAMLFDQSGGQLTEEMARIIAESTKCCRFIYELIEEIKAIWDEWDNSDGEKNNRLSFIDFYNGFLSKYVGCYRCEDSQKALQCIDIDHDGEVDWYEFKNFLVWAGREYPKVQDAEELLEKAFVYGLLPAMADEVLTSRAAAQASRAAS